MSHFHFVPFWQCLNPVSLPSPEWGLLISQSYAGKYDVLDNTSNINFILLSKIYAELLGGRHVITFFSMVSDENRW